MTNTEQKWLKEIRDNTRQLKRIADKLDVIARAIVDEDEGSADYNKVMRCWDCVNADCDVESEPCAGYYDFDRYCKAKTL